MSIIGNLSQEVSTRRAEAELAYELQGAQVQQDIKEERMEIDLVERRKQVRIEWMPNKR